MQKYPAARRLFPLVALLSLSMAASARAQTYFVATTQASVSGGGGFSAGDGSMLIVGQPLAGRMVAPDCTAPNSPCTIDIGVVAFLYPPSVSAPIYWNTGVGDWNIAANWLPTVVPNNDNNLTYLQRQ